MHGEQKRTEMTPLIQLLITERTFPPASVERTSHCCIVEARFRYRRRGIHNCKERLIKVIQTVAICNNLDPISSKLKAAAAPYCGDS